MVDGDKPFWLRSSVFMDYGETYLLETQASNVGSLHFWGTGWSLTGNIGSHLDARLTVAFPLIATAYLAIAVCLGWLSLLLIERPALRLRDRFLPAMR